MLWTDRDFVRQADLAMIDGETPSVVTTEQLAIDGVNGLGRQACDECGRRLLDAAQSFGHMAPPGISAPHIGALLNVWPVATPGNVPRFHLSQVCVTSQQPGYMSHLKQWVTYYALQRLFRAAYARKVSDRFEKKATLYADELRSRVWPMVMNLGVPLVLSPMACPGALHEFGAGEWSESGNLTTVASGAAAEGAYFVAITWVDDSKYKSATDKGNGESGPSEPLSFTIPASNVLKVDISNLTAPDGKHPKIGMAQGALTPLKATDWNIYVGSTADKMYLQNSTLIDYATKTYTLAAAPILSGTLLDEGQVADVYHTIYQMLNRA